MCRGRFTPPSWFSLLDIGPAFRGGPLFNYVVSDLQVGLFRASARVTPPPSFCFAFSPLCHPDRSTPLVSRVPFTGTADIFFRSRCANVGRAVEAPWQHEMFHLVRWDIPQLLQPRPRTSRLRCRRKDQQGSSRQRRNHHPTMARNRQTTRPPHPRPPRPPRLRLGNKQMR